jgi:putative YphP/YqiW family bacilliredoxin
MYDENLVAPMRKELTEIGFQELRSPDDVVTALEQISTPEETAMVVVNSVCGCAAGGARPGIRLAVENGLKVDKLLTVFAGQDGPAVSKARDYFHGFAPSSPSIAFLKGGKIQSMIERRDIEGFNKLQIAEKILKHSEAMKG